MARKPTKQTKPVVRDEDEGDEDVVVSVQPQIEPAIPTPPSPPIVPSVKPDVIALAAEKALEDAKVVSTKRRLLARDVEPKLSVHELNKRHEAERAREIAAHDAQYLKAIAAVQVTFGKIGQPVPNMAPGGVAVMPVASPFAQQLAAQNNAAKSE